MRLPAQKSRRSGRARPGVVLLEVLVAVTLFAVASAALLQATITSTRALERAQTAETELRRANAFFGAVALWGVDDLDRHLGDRIEGPWHLIIEHPAEMLYVVALADSSEKRVILQTVLFRPTAVNGVQAPSK